MSQLSRQSIVPSLIPRSWMDMDLFDRPLSLLGPSSLDLFDPFDEIDRRLSRNVSWLSEPTSLLPALDVIPLVPEKHRITVNCPGISEDSIKTEVKNNKLIVKACEGNPEQKGKGDYYLNKMQRTFDLPQHCDTKNLVSYKVGDRLIVEMPIKQTLKKPDVPHVTGSGENKKVEFNVTLPSNIDPSKVSCTCKDRDVIIKADYHHKEGDVDSKVHYFRRSTLPYNTDFNSLTCSAVNDHQLKIEAQLGPNPNKSIPIQGIKQQQLPQQQQQQSLQQGSKVQQQQAEKQQPQAQRG